MEAASAFGADTIDNPEINVPGMNPWRRCAHILYAAKFYE
jgi:hypothetical protein